MNSKAPRPISQMSLKEVKAAIRPIIDMGFECQYLGDQIKTSAPGNSEPYFLKTGADIQSFIEELMKFHESDRSTGSESGSAGERGSLAEWDTRPTGEIAASLHGMAHDEIAGLIASGAGEVRHLIETIGELEADMARAARKEKRQAGEIARLRARLGELESGDGSPAVGGAGQLDHFRRLKKEFAKMYHPDNSPSPDGLEKLIRSEIFKEFWAVIEGIEKGTLSR